MKGDLFAGLSIACVSIPQSLAYAALAGMPPVHGLYAALVAPLAAGLFASSPYLQTGPGAMTSLMTFGALASVATPFSASYATLAALLALIVGSVRIVLGAVRAGGVTYLMSEPVVLGFTTAAALLIVGSQIPSILGLAAEPLSSVMMSGQWKPESIVVALATFLCVKGGRMLHPLFPGVVVAVAVGTIWSVFAGYEGAVVGELPTGLPSLSLDLDWSRASGLVLPGIIIAIVGFAEPAAIARTIAAQTRRRWSADRELVSQGVANVAAGVFAGFPVGGSFSRTQVNRTAGARSQLSSFVATGVMVLFLPWVHLLADLPLAVLAAIVVSAVVELIRFDRLFALVRVSRAQACVALATFGLTLAMAPRIDLAIVGGIALGVGVHLWRERRVSVQVSYIDGCLRLEPTGVLFFGSASVLDEALNSALARHGEATELVMDLRRVGRIDYTGATVIKQIAEDASAAGLSVRIVPGGRPRGGRLLERVFGDGSPWLVSPKSE